MKFYTRGRTIYPDAVIPLSCVQGHFDIPNFTDDCFKLIIIDAGSGIITINDKKLPFSGPALFCINERDRVTMLKGDTITTSEIYFQPDVVNSKLTIPNLRSPSLELSATERQDRSFLQAFLHRDDAYPGQITIGLSTYQRIKFLYSTLTQSLTEQIDDFWPCRSRSYFLELLFLLERTRLTPAAAPAQPLPQNSDDLDDIILYLHNNYQNKITLDQLAEKFCTNRTSLSQKFKERFGMPIITYLIKHRISIAASILRDTTMPIEEITSRVGFADLTHFGRVFKKETSLAPSEYRNEYNWMLHY